MAREVTDAEGITWSCIQAYAGLSDGGENQEAAKVKGEKDSYWVVCTPSGGAKSVRLELQGEWESSYSDEALLEQIEAQLKA
ncbi:hypothetical protein H6F77_24645 [Microcoleus sp. FACHB-831]|uniref:hypothetical protein n=1 Tax=Microcoleus sp. FACHB-831 TaxID=2692827 RepID=UPI0016873182|nr:hypothetical protein [Microcoleus sp. FACHB-831]MBD1924234.1 hypothetical protein [Microcoleus sp. FACHB-831]